MHAHGVEVLDRADDDRIVGPVAHHLELVLLPSLDRLLDEHLPDRRGVDAVRDDAIEFLRGVSEARSPTAEDETGTDHRRIAELADRLLGVLERLDVEGARRLQPGLLHELLESSPVLGSVDGIERRTDQLDTELLEHTEVSELHGDIECRLTSQGREYGIWPFLAQDLGHHLRRDGLDVRGIGELGIGHDRRGVGIDEHDPVSELSEDLHRLGSGIVELTRLTDDDGAGPDHQDRVQVVTLRHGLLPRCRRSDRTAASHRSGQVRPRGGTGR